MAELKAICVFCGSSRGVDPVYSEAADRLGRAIVRHGLRMVYGGGQVGLMGVLADAALEAGGEVIGVIPEALALKEVAHEGLTEMRVVGSMHERKAMMADLSDAFVAMPGGFGTFEEFCEIVTWAQLGLHTKPCGLLNVNGYYDALLALFDRGLAEAFIRPQHRALVIDEADPERLLDHLLAWQPAESGPILKWIQREET